MKKTKARTLILKLFNDNPETSYTASDIYRQIMMEDINLSTVYRTLLAFEKEGIVKKEVSPFTKEASYSLSLEEHGHVLECVKCHKRIVLDYCPFEEVNEDIRKRTGFELEEENHVLYGTCKECKEKESKN